MRKESWCASRDNTMWPKCGKITAYIAIIKKGDEENMPVTKL